jgi:DNA-binding transcriptional LysR family regulator
LIVRNSREFSWTTAGKTVLGAAEAMKPLVENATRDVRGQKQGAVCAVRVSLPPAFSSLMTRLLVARTDAPREVALELCGENRTVDLAKGEADLALRMFRPTEPGMVCRQVLEFGWVACASPAYIESRGVPKCPADLADHSIIQYVESFHRVAGPRWLEENRGCARISVYVDNTEVAAHTIASGAGIGVVPAFLAESRKGEVVRVFPEPVAFTTGFIVYHETVRDVGRIRAASDFLRSVIEENAQVFTGRIKERAQR